MSKITFPVDMYEDRMPGDVVTNKSWCVKRDGVVVGYINSRISDANQDYSNPGYTVTVSGHTADGESFFIKQSGTFNNRSMTEARENRSRYVSMAKDAAREKF